jgi:hypothetical protein
MSYGYQTDMRLSRCVDYVATGRLEEGPYQDPERQEGIMKASIRVRQVGWLDQKGRVWIIGAISFGTEFDGGSLTPLLIQDED